MASPASPIQRKSIHNLSTAVTVAIAIALSLAACAGRSSSTPETDRVLQSTDPMNQTIHLKTNDEKEVGFRLLSGGVPIGGQRVMFTIAEGSGNGGYVQPTDAVTDSAGVAKTIVHARSPTTFKVRAWTRDAMADTVVIVNNEGTGSVNVAPFFLPTSEAQPLGASIEVLFIDRMACANLVLVLAQPTAEHDPQSVHEPGGSVLFEDVGTMGSHAVVGIAKLDGLAFATGCVDLPGSAVVLGGVVELALPLADAVPDPVGKYAVTTQLKFSSPLVDTVPIAAAYRQLSDCPLDPAELLLDCTIDALSPATADDPLDCVPAPGAGAEGAVAAKLAARRGVPILDGAGVAAGCRGARDANGRVSFDAVVLGLYGSPKPPVLVELPAIANDAAHLFDRIKLASTLEFQPAGTPSSYTVTHTLVSAEFENSPPDPGNRFAAAIDIPGFPVPVPKAFALATTAEDELLLGEQGFTLRLGSLARTGFAAVALDRRGIAGGATGLMTTIAGLARSEDGTYRGCAAIDHALCAEIDEAPGCLVTACGNGMTAFAAHLDDLFAAVDGAALDLYMAGTATLHDIYEDGTAGRIGAAPGDATGAGAWTFELRTRSERRTISASFVGLR